MQRAILLSGLVNWVGLDTTFKPIDLALEHLNCNCKIDLRNAKNSTHDIELVFQRTALCNKWLRGLRNCFENLYGEAMSSAHTFSAAISDMFLLAWTIYTGGYATARAASSLTSSAMLDSNDVFGIGMELLEEKVDQFNTQHLHQERVLPQLSEINEKEDTTFTDISAFAEVIHDGYDIVNNAIINPARMPRIPTIDLT